MGIEKRKSNIDKMIFEEEVAFAYIEFSDPTYSPGWNTLAGYPTTNDAKQIACGILVKEEDEYYIIATAKGKNVGGDDVLNPFLIFKSLITNIEIFTRESLDDRKSNRKTRKNPKGKT